MSMSHRYKGITTLSVVFLAFTLSSIGASTIRSAELVYDTEAASLPTSVRRYVSISGCQFICNAECTLQEGLTDNFCMMVAFVLQGKTGNFRQGHFDPQHYSQLPDDRDSATCKGGHYGSYTDYTSEFAVAANGPITGYQMWHDLYLVGLRFRYGNVWGKAFGKTSFTPSCYMQFADDEVITKTEVIDGMWLDDVIITTSYREYPKLGDKIAMIDTNTGRELRYIGAGHSPNAVSFGYGIYASGLKVYFLC